MPHLRAIVSNRFTTFPDWWLADSQANTDSGLDAMFCYRMKGWEHTAQAANGWDGYITLLNGEKVGTGLFLHKRAALEESGYTFEIIENRKYVRFYEEADCALVGREPYPWHRKAVEFIREHANTGGLIIAPTSTGKTSLAGWAFARLQGTGLFVVNDTALGMQTKAELEKILGEPVGFVGAGKFSIERVTVALVQTLAARSKDPRFDRLMNVSLMLIDEVHVMLHKQMWKSILAYVPRVCFGLTATLNLDNAAVALPAYALCGSAVFEYHADEARANKEITEGWAYTFDVPTIVDGTDMNYGQLYNTYVVGFTWLNEFMVHLALAAVAKGYTVLILVKQHDHLDAITAHLERMGAEYLTYSGKQTGGSRIVIRNAIDAGVCPLAVGTTGAITKGISIPRLNFIIDGSQMKAWENTVQRAGRGARLDTGKDHFVYVDLGQSAQKVRGVRKRNLFALHATERRKGLMRTGYKMRHRAIASTHEAETEAASALNFILQLE